MSTAAAEDEATISIPSIAFVVFVGFLVYRYLWTTTTTTTPPRSGPSSSSSSSSSSHARQPYTAAQVDQVVQMFPTLSRRDVMWDLQRNRGNVQATTERILMGGRLEPAPPSFQPTVTPPPAPSTTSNTGVSSPRTAAAPEPDLITRYNLQGRVDPKGKGKEKEEEPSHGWSSVKEERQAMLQRRRDEMILAARRKMQERDEAQRAAGLS